MPRKYPAPLWHALRVSTASAWSFWIGKKHRQRGNVSFPRPTIREAGQMWWTYWFLMRRQDPLVRQDQTD